MKVNLLYLATIVCVLQGLSVLACATQPEGVSTQDDTADAAIADEFLRLNSLPGCGPLLEQSSGNAMDHTALDIEEQRILAVAETNASELLDQAASGCREVWDNETQQYLRICREPLRDAFMGGLAGGLLGGLFGPAAFGSSMTGVEYGLIGAVVGSVFAYAITSIGYD